MKCAKHLSGGGKRPEASIAVSGLQLPREDQARFGVVLMSVRPDNQWEAATLATDKESQEISRRSFIQRTAIGGAGLLAAIDI